jgi:hypothetical protein
MGRTRLLLSKSSSRARMIGAASAYSFIRWSLVSFGLSFASTTEPPPSLCKQAERPA